MRVEVLGVRVPAWSTLGVGHGLTDHGTVMVEFVGDHVEMRALGEAILAGRLPVAEVPEHNVILAEELPEEDADASQPT